MEENLFKRLLDSSKDNVDKSMNDMYYYNYIYDSIAKKIYELFENNKDLSNEDVEKILYYELDDFLEKQNTVGVKKIVFKQIVQEKLKQNPAELRKIYNQVVNEIDDEYEIGVRSNEISMDFGNYNETRLGYVKYSIVHLRALKEKIICDYFGITDQNYEKYRDAEQFMLALSNIGTNKRKQFIKRKFGNVNIEFLVPLYKESEADQLEYWNREYGYDYEEDIKSHCIQGILLNIDFLNKYGILDDQISKKKKYYERISNKEYIQDKKISDFLLDFSYDKDEILEMFSEENLKKRSVKQLIALNAELSNIATKSIKDINKVLFIIKQLDLINDIKNGQNLLLEAPDNDKINEETLKAVFEKSVIVQSLVTKILKKMCYNNGTIINTDDEVAKMSKSYIKDYKNYFSKYLPYSNNDILEDFNYYKTGELIKSNLYKHKDDNMLSLVSIFEMDDTKNWGVMLNEGKDSIEDEDFLLLGFDVSELTMPIKLHIPKNILIDYMKNVHSTTAIRLYDGAYDFSISDQRIPSHGVYIMNNKFKNALNNIVKSIDENSKLYNFIMHINYLYKNDYSKSMKVYIGKNKKGKHRYSKIERYIDLENDEIFTKEQLKIKNDCKTNVNQNFQDL